MRACRVLVIGQIKPASSGQAVMVRQLLRICDPNVAVRHLDASMSNSMGDMRSITAKKLVKLLVLPLRIIWSVFVYRPEN